MRALLCLLLSYGTALSQGALREVTDREADEHKVAKIVFAHRGEWMIKNETLRSAMRIVEGERCERRFFKSEII